MQITSNERLNELKAMNKEQLFNAACKHDVQLMDDDAIYYSRTDLYDMILDAEYPEESLI